MRDTVLLLDVPDSGADAMYHQAARSLGLVPVLVTAYPLGGSSVAASERLQVSGMDVAAILSAIDQFGRERIAGVFASASARAELAARVASALDRPHADPDAISLCNDKHRLRAFLEHKSLNTVEYRYVTTVPEARRAAERLGGVVVVKPPSSSGSDGVRICRTSEEAAFHVKRLLRRKLNGVILEKYIEDPLFSVDCFDGKALNVRRLLVFPGPFPITAGHNNPPASLQSGRLTEIKNYASSILKIIGMVDGPSAVQLRDSGTDIYLIEINPRPGLFGPMVALVVAGINIAELCLRFSCGIPYEQGAAVKTNGRAFATRFVVRNGSSVRAIKGGDEARKVPGVKSVEIDGSQFYRRGPGTSSLDRIVAIHSEADTMEQAAACAELALKKLRVIYDSFPMSLAKYYSGKFSRLRIKILKRLKLRKRRR